MVTKSPKPKMLRRRRFKNTNPRVHLQKLDENVLKAYKAGLAGRSCNTSSSIKEERSCIFTSAVDLNENENDHLPSSDEQNCSCCCNYCSPYYEMKLRAQQEFLDAVENQGNENTFPYLCNLVQDNVYVPLVNGKRDAQTQTTPRRYKYKCKDCSSEFNNDYYFDQHVLVHRKLYECPYCNACFTSGKQLQSHVLFHLCKNFFECPYCSCAFPSKKQLIKHISCHDKVFFECGECKAKFHTDKALQYHKKSHNSSGNMIHVFKVAVNNESEPELSIQETESANVFSPEEPTTVGRFYQCNLCNLHFSNERVLRRHSVIHSRNAANYLHVCTVCNARFRANNYLARHQQMAHKPL